MSLAEASPPFRHDRPEKTGLLFVNLGTPAAPTAAATRAYLAQFLSDPRVVEIPKLVWRPLLHGLVLRTRPAKSARKYAQVWTPDGSPLAVWTARQATLLRGYLGERGALVEVRWAMRYGKPAIAAELDALCAAGASRVLVFPAYPQYSAATTASVLDDVGDWIKRTRRLPELRFVNHYHDEPDYIDALAGQVLRHWAREGRGRMLVLSFHGMPARTLRLGDPYHCECRKTGRLLAARLGLRDDEWRLTFQSRFGRAAWLQPYTHATLAALAREGVAGVDVLCPGFAADCLETLEEIAIEGRAAFLAAGGRDFHYLPCLNDSPEGMRALAAVALRHLQGWPVAPDAGPDGAALQERQARARALGASA
jgi:ferrochelatase